MQVLARNLELEISGEHEGVVTYGKVAWRWSRLMGLYGVGKSFGVSGEQAWVYGGYGVIGRTGWERRIMD